MPLSHVSLPTGPSHFKDMRDFYVSTLAPLGYTVFMEKDGEDGRFLGMGLKNSSPDFWLHCGSTEFTKFNGNLEKRGGQTHIAFQVSRRSLVTEWYELAIKSGGVPNGKPGERPQYISGYYAAYVIDPLGNNVEVMYWSPAWLKALNSLPYVFTGLAGAALAVGLAKFYN